MWSQEVQTEAVAFGKVGLASVQSDRGQLSLAEPERAGHRVLDVERTVEFAVEPRFRESTGGGEVRQPHGGPVAGTLPMEKERVVRDVRREHARRVRKIG